MLLELFESLISNGETLSAFETERPRHHSNGQDAHITRHLSNNGRTASTGTAAHASRNKYHIGTLKRLGNTIAVLKGSRSTNLGIRTRSETLRDRITQL